MGNRSSGNPEIIGQGLRSLLNRDREIFALIPHMNEEELDTVLWRYVYYHHPESAPINGGYMTTLSPLLHTDLQLFDDELVTAILKRQNELRKYGSRLQLLIVDLLIIGAHLDARRVFRRILPEEREKICRFIYLPRKSLTGEEQTELYDRIHSIGIKPDMENICRYFYNNLEEREAIRLDNTAVIRYYRSSPLVQFLIENYPHTMTINYGGGSLASILQFPPEMMDRLNPAEESSEIDCLLGKIHELEEKMERVYYAPGMPGYLEARDDFGRCIELRERIASN